MSVLLSVSQLATKLRGGDKTTLLDCTWVPGDGMSEANYTGGHIPTALFCDPPSRLAASPNARKGRNPLPSEDALYATFDALGLNSDHEIIVYDSGRGLMSARAWWVLTWAGVKGVKILTGGLRAWVQAGHTVVGGPGNIPRDRSLTPRIGALPTVGLEEVKNRPADVLLLDAREANRYAGRKERLDLKAGHIPGAVSLPLEDLTDSRHEFLPADTMARAFRDAGVKDPAKVIVYSGSGLHSAAAIAAMHEAGLAGAALYAGGWSQWCADPQNPVERSL